MQKTCVLRAYKELDERVSRGENDRMAIIVRRRHIPLASTHTKNATIVQDRVEREKGTALSNLRTFVEASDLPRPRGNLDQLDPVTGCSV
jgi:hypothetical protein